MNKNTSVRLYQAYLQKPDTQTTTEWIRECVEKLGTTTAYAKKMYYRFRAGYKPQFIALEDADLAPEPQSSRTWEEGTESAYFEGTSEKVITTLEEALAFTKVDLTKWDVEKWRFKSYDVTMKLKTIDKGPDDKYHAMHKPHKRTNYAVQVWFKKRDDTAERIQSLIDDAGSWSRVSVVKSKGSGIGALNISDLHIGADIRDLVRTPDFNVDILREYLARIAARVNEYGFKEVHINMAGDYFESLSGLNHPNSWKSMMRDGTGQPIIRIASDILVEFMGSVRNLSAVNMVAGNHDRITPDNKIDNMGEAAATLAYILGLRMPKVPIDFHYFLISKEIDAIRYVMTHGDKSINAKDATKILFEYGDREKFNLLISGHTHTRAKKHTISMRPVSYHDISVIQIDDLMYRQITLPALFTGNYYSETLGYASRGGAVITMNNGRGVPEVHDIPM